MSDADNLTSQEDQELYRYGYKLLIMQAINIAVAIAIGLAFACLKEMIFFLAVFIPLRSYAGGYHAGGPIACGILSAGMELAVAVALQAVMTVQTVYVILAASVLCEITIYVLAPLAAQNKPLTDSQVISFKRKTRLILGMEAVIMVILYVASVWTLSLVIALCHMLVAGLLVAGKMAATVKKQ